MKKFRFFIHKTWKYFKPRASALLEWAIKNISFANSKITINLTAFANA